MSRNTKVGYLVLSLLALTTILSIVVWAESSYPFGVREVNYVQSSKANATGYAADSIEAEAGNVTELSLVGISTTQAWQGYYGNITGIITLEDVNGNVFYNWSANEPKGELFASTSSSVTWANITCFNWSNNTPGQNGFGLEQAEATYGMGDDTSDGINETYINGSLNSDIFVASRNLSGNATDLGITCHTTNPFQFGSQSSNGDNFENFLLNDGGQYLVFAGIVENNEFNNITDIIGFDNAPHDFQLLVAENGFQGFEDTTTTYYFWLEMS